MLHTFYCIIIHLNYYNLKIFYVNRYIIEKLGIACYTTHDIDKHGIDYVMEHAIESVNPGLRYPMHVSYDIDALDPAVSPATGTPGILWRPS